MKKNYIPILACLLTIGLVTACDSNPQSSTAPTTQMDAPADPAAPEDAAPADPEPAPQALSEMPYTVSVEKSATQPSDASHGIQSSAHGYNGTYLMMVGGRIQGFHGTANAEGVFESSYSNDKIAILNPETGDYKTMDLPEKYKTFLMSTNMEYYYDGTYLICVGGYGAYCTTCTPEQFKTFPRVTAIHFDKAVAAIEQNDADALMGSMITLKDERMRVTGGGLERIGDYYYLVFGQDYDTIYIGGITGKYTEEVRKFKMDISDDEITISDYEVFSDPSSATKDQFSQYHRRDLNVCAAMRPDGTEGITALGGVFTKDDGGWVYPVLIDDNEESPVQVYEGLEQKLSQYECSLVSFFDPSSKTMFHTLMGGVSYYFYQDGKLTPSTIDNWLPFTSSITTIVHNAAGMQEFPQPEEQSLPKLMGSDAAFIPNGDLSFVNDANTIIDWSTITEKTHVGWIYGGINSMAAQSSEFEPTSASNELYDVWVTPK